MGVICASVHACFSVSSFLMKKSNLREDIFDSYSHANEHPEEKKNALFYREEEREKRGEREIQLITTEQMFKLCVGLSVSSLRLSRAKLQRWPV